MSAEKVAMLCSVECAKLAKGRADRADEGMYRERVRQNLERDENTNRKRLSHGAAGAYLGLASGAQAGRALGGLRGGSAKSRLIGGAAGALGGAVAGGYGGQRLGRAQAKATRENREGVEGKKGLLHHRAAIGDRLAQLGSLSTRVRKEELAKMKGS